MRKKAERIFFLAMLVTLLAAIPILAKPAPGLAPLAPLSGKWVGRGQGISGPSVVKQNFSFVLSGFHLANRSTARYKPKKGETVGRFSKTIGIFSFDKIQKKIIYREFRSDGTFQYFQLITLTKDKKTFVFQSVNRTNQEQKILTRLVFHLIDRDHLQEAINRATDGKTFKKVESFQLRRVTKKKENRFRKARKDKPEKLF
ncbi:MAG: hypothetical protein DRJ08_07660 [Acidobacteria bacterium]|nr:MAG: hypothetical protein DRJ08_07660 [Acidobacteriota bacterium]